MLKTIKQCEDYIFSNTLDSKRTNLNDIKKLMSSLGDPQDKLKYIHIAGTNGKGSSAILLSTILINSNYKVGLFTSPHLIKINERIKINNIDISNKDIIKYTNIVKKTIEKQNTKYNAFDIFTAIMFLYFSDKNVDIVILETGLGGRLDSTNIIKKPLISLITTLSLEHTGILGNSIESIAKEKAGIIKKNSIVVYYPSGNKANKIIKDKARKLNCRIIKVNFKHIKRHKTSFDYEYYKNLKLNLKGDYQIYNSVCVLKVIDELKLLGYKIKNINKSFKEVYWPGRIEVISKKPLIIIDGSHNPQGIRTIIPYIKKYNVNNVVIGMYKDKDYKSVINELLPFCDNYICVKPNNIRGQDPKLLEKYITSKGMKASIIKNMKSLIKCVKNSSNSTIIVGSLRLVGDIEKLYIRTK